MEYSKSPRSYAEQADLLQARGLIADRGLLIERLKSVNYYRLSGYLHTFRQMDAEGRRLDSYHPGTLFASVWRRYTFDRQLRLLTLDGIERIEIALKTRITHDHSLKHGPFGYLDPSKLPRLTSQRHQEFLNRVHEETERSREDFVTHFSDKYGDRHTHLPLWMATEVMSYGSVLTLFHGMAEKDLKKVAADFCLNLPLLDSWITTLNSIRNICAHHGRLWNRELGVKPKIPFIARFPEWHSPVPTRANRIFSVLTIIKYFLGYIAPQSKWPDRLKCMLEEYSEIPLNFMGFPIDWQNHSIWNPNSSQNRNKA